MCSHRGEEYQAKRASPLDKSGGCRRHSHRGAGLSLCVHVQHLLAVALGVCSTPLRLGFPVCQRVPPSLGDSEVVHVLIRGKCLFSTVHSPMSECSPFHLLLPGVRVRGREDHKHSLLSKGESHSLLTKSLGGLSQQRWDRWTQEIRSERTAQWDFPAVQWLKLHLPMKATWVQSWWGN